MFSNPYSLFFTSSVVLSTMIALSSSQWLIIWVALELNMMSFIPLFMLSKSAQASESSVKYFLAQALGSIILLFSFSTQFSYSLVLVGFMLKAGMAPFHFWFPLVMSGTNWIVGMLLLTWQKIIPMFFLITNISVVSHEVIYLIGGVNALIGGFGGLNQTAMRPLLAYSSIGHMGWMLVAGAVAATLFFFYFFIYLMLNIGIMFVFLKAKIKGVGFSKMGKDLVFYISLVVCFLSLGGLPPLLGFFPKWMVLMKLNYLIMAFFLIVGSLMNLIYYLNICFSIYISSNNFYSSFHSLKISNVEGGSMLIFINMIFPLMFLV